VLPKPVRLFSFEGDYLLPGAGEVLIDSLLSGQTVVLICRCETGLGTSLFNQWSASGRAPEGRRSYTDSVARHCRLNFDSAKHQRGSLVILQVTATMPQSLAGGNLRTLRQEDIQVLTAAAGAEQIVALPARSRVTEPGVTVKDLCLLHLRDGHDAHGVPARVTTAHLKDRTEPVSWTELQAIIRQLGSYAEQEIDSLRTRGLIDSEKRSFYLAAIDFLDAYSGSAVRENIYDLVWFHEFLEEDGQLFRGQADHRWTLDSSLFRAKTDGSALDLGTLYERAHATQQFLAEVRARQQELFGRELPENELLAIAQHYGFPTPLLDFTRSLRVAAFFATNDARELERGREQIGVVYHLKPTPKEFRLRDGSKLEQSIGIGTFRLIEKAGIRIGEFQYIEPKLQGDDDRIGRQEGVFLDGFYPRDLREIAVDRITFQQKPGEVFEDPAAGITTAQLLPEHSTLQKVALQVRERLKQERANHTLLPALGHTLIPSAGVLGSAGAELRMQIEEAQWFFKDLNQQILEGGETKLGLEVDRVLSEYFALIRLQADVGLPSAGGNEPLKAAVARLEELANIGKDKLWEVIAELAPEYWVAPSDAPPLSRTPANPRERIVLSCALYLVAWSHLCTVNGWRARAFSNKAREVLASYGDTGPVGIENEISD